MTPPSDKLPPRILEEEDTPLINSLESINENIIFDKELQKEKDAEKWIEKQRFSLGSNILGWCLFLMTFCIILSIYNPENELIKNGFDAFKMIVVTILGYFFGANTKDK